MGNTKRELSKDEENNRDLVFQFYNSMNYMFTQKAEREAFYNIVKTQKIKSMAIGFCPLKMTTATMILDSAIHAYAFFELENANQHYTGLMIEYGPYKKDEIREDYYFYPIYPFIDGLRYGMFLREMFDKMSYLNNIKSSLIHINNRLTFGEIISNLNTGTPWNKNSYNLITHNCQDLIVKLISLLEAELLEEYDIINKDYSLELRMPDKILRAFHNIYLNRMKNNLPVQKNNVYKGNEFFGSILLFKDIGNWIRALKNKKKGIVKEDGRDYYKSTPETQQIFDELKSFFQKDNLDNK